MTNLADPTTAPKASSPEPMSRPPPHLARSHRHRRGRCPQRPDLDAGAKHRGQWIAGGRGVRPADDRAGRAGSRWPIPAATAIALGAVLNPLVFPDMVRCAAAVPAALYVAFAVGARSREGGAGWARPIAGLLIVLADLLAQYVWDRVLQRRFLLPRLRWHAGGPRLGSGHRVVVPGASTVEPVGGSERPLTRAFRLDGGAVGGGRPTMCPGGAMSISGAVRRRNVRQAAAVADLAGPRRTGEPARHCRSGSRLDPLVSEQSGRGRPLAYPLVLMASCPCSPCDATQLWLRLPLRSSRWSPADRRTACDMWGRRADGIHHGLPVGSRLLPTVQCALGGVGLLATGAIETLLDPALGTAEAAVFVFVSGTAFFVGGLTIRSRSAWLRSFVAARSSSPGSATAPPRGRCSRPGTDRGRPRGEHPFPGHRDRRSRRVRACHQKRRGASDAQRPPWLEIEQQGRETLAGMRAVVGGLHDAPTEPPPRHRRSARSAAPRHHRRRSAEVRR